MDRSEQYTSAIALIAELHTTHARRHRTTPALGAVSSAETPLPWHEGASRALAVLVAILGSDPAQAARQARAVCTDEGLSTVLQAALDAGWTVVDKPLQRRFLGACSCGDALWGPPPAGNEGPTFVTCSCGRTHSVQGRRAWLLRCAEDVLVTYATATRALPLLLHHQCSINTIRGWVGKGKVTPVWWIHPITRMRSRARPTHPRATPLLRLGDLLDIVAPSQPA